MAAPTEIIFKKSQSLLTFLSFGSIIYFFFCQENEILSFKIGVFILPQILLTRASSPLAHS
jgi:hypothetical protein